MRLFRGEQDIFNSRSYHRHILIQDRLTADQHRRINYRAKTIPPGRARSRREAPVKSQQWAIRVLELLWHEGIGHRQALRDVKRQRE